MKSTCCGVRLIRLSDTGEDVHRWICEVCGEKYSQRIRVKKRKEVKSA